MNPLPTVSVFGTTFHISTFEELLEIIDQAIATNRPLAIDTSNTMVAGLAATDPRFRQALSAIDLRVPDSMPLVWYMRAVGGKITHTCYAPELLTRIWRRFGGDRRIVVIGADEETRRLFEMRFARPHCWVTRRIDPGSPEEIQRLRLELEAVQADIICVGLSCPKSYFVLEQILPSIRRGVVVNVGGSFDLVSGRQRVTPYPIQRLGLGWLFRLCCEPGRLWKRYLKYNSLFILLALRYYGPDRLRNRPAGS